MKVWQFPLARITLGLVFGILFAFFSALSLSSSLILLSVSTLAFGVTFYIAQKQWIQNAAFGWAVYFLSFCLGSATFALHLGTNHRSNYIHQLSNSDATPTLEVVLREKLKSSQFNYRYLAIVKRIHHQNCTGRILINCNKETIKELSIGTQLQIKSGVVLPTQPLNPDQFDYGKYLNNKSILGQVYVDASEVKISPVFVKDAFYYSDAIRRTILKNLEHDHFKPNELAVLGALLLGQQQEIASEIVHDYQLAGAVHILSVSGLHVGFIVLFLNFVLNFLPKKKRYSYFKLGLTLAALWSFAILAGLSPSVIRSVTMFSFLAIGLHLKRKTNIFHTLLVSLFLILIFEPSFLFDVGFQLSYVALFFIVWVQPMLDPLWQPKNKFAIYFWNILTVSFAAQIGTLPLSIYYFHQFPGLFFVTNLIVIPFLSLIMGLGLLVVVLAFWNRIPAFLLDPLEQSITLLNYMIHRIASLERFIIQDIPCNSWMMISLYLGIFAFIFCFKKPNFQRIIGVLVTVLIFQVSYFCSKWNTQKHNEWIVFNAKKTTIIAERLGENVTVYTSDLVATNNPITPYLVANFCSITATKPLGNLAYFNSKKIVLLDSSGSYPRNVKPDILVFRQSPKVNLDRVLQTCKPKIIVADASNYKSYVGLWKATCLKEKIPFHNTNEKGFFRMR